MILSIDLSPSVYKWLEINGNSGNAESFNAENTGMIPGDGGSYLSLILRLMNEDSTITGFAGGHTGSFIRSYLEGVGVVDRFVGIGDRNPERLILTFDDREIEINQKNVEINRDEIGLFHRELKEGLNNCEIVCLCGGYPLNMPDDMPTDILHLSREWGRRILISPGMDALLEVVEAAPFLIVLDIEGMEKLTNLKLQYEGELIRASQYLFQNDISYVLVDMGENGLLVMNSENGLSMSLAESGLKSKQFMHGGLLAGFAAGMKRKYDLETTARLSFACGSLDIRSHDGNPDMADIKALMNKIDIRKFHNQ